MKRMPQSITGMRKNVIGDNMALYRKARKLTQEKLSQKLEVHGLSICRDSICRIERGERAVCDYEALMIARVLGVDMNKLYADALPMDEDAL